MFVICRLSDVEYSVLNEIRKNKSTSIDRLKMMYFGDADPAVQKLEEYGLIESEISSGRYYYCTTDAGMNYRHEQSVLNLSDVKNVNGRDAHKDNPNKIKNKNQEPGKKRHINWSAVGAIGAIVGKIFDFIAKFLCP